MTRPEVYSTCYSKLVGCSACGVVIMALEEGQNPLSAVSSSLLSCSHPFAFLTARFCLPNHFLLTPRLASFPCLILIFIFLLFFPVLYLRPAPPCFFRGIHERERLLLGAHAGLNYLLLVYLRSCSNLCSIQARLGDVQTLKEFSLRVSSLPCPLSLFRLSCFFSSFGT